MLAPVALAALATLLIPLVIHIARRTESRTVQFAALRWLDPRPKPRRRLRVDERWLLAIRLLLLAAIAVWLARPVLWGVADDRPVVALAPDIDAATIDFGGDDRRVWLAPGFPAVDDATPTTSTGLISLIRQLDAELPPETPVELIVPATLDGVDAERPRLSRSVAWRMVPASGTAPAPTPPPALTVRYSAQAEDGVRYFRAAATAWTPTDATPAFEAAPLDRPIEADARHLVWLASGPLPDPIVAWIRDGGTALLSRDTRLSVEGEISAVWRDALGEPLVVAGRVGQGRVLQLTRPLEPAAMPQLVEPDFPDALLRMLSPMPAAARVAATDHAPLTGTAAYDQPPFDVRSWLALIIALIFGTERWLATRRSRAVAP